MPKTKFLTGELPTPFYVPTVSLIDSIKKHLSDGWTLKGEMVRASSSSSIWVQRVVKN
jgi:hypothetical protein